MSKLNRAKAAIVSDKTPRRLKRSAWLLSAAVAVIALAHPAQAQAQALSSTALPTDGVVVAGGASIGTPTPSSMTINQSTDRAVINWNTFDIGSGASVTFVQPSTTAIAVNRVTGGGAPSEIAGQLNANGRVAILNPNGVLFSGTANVNVGSLIASTGDIDVNAFYAGGNLDITGATGGSIVVEGHVNITAGNLGLAAFVAPTVRNSGVITATGGRVQLGAGSAFTLDLAGDGLLQISVAADNPLIQNFGDISGRRIELSARQVGALVDQTIRTGVLPVGSARLDGNTIVLDAAGQDFTVSSDITGTGTVTVNANRISGTNDINVAGALTLNVNSQGAVADTTIGSSNWINDALGVIGGSVTGTTINLGAGLYRSGTVINNSNVTLDGQGVAKIGWTAGVEDAINVWGSNVTVKNMEIFGPAVGTPYYSFDWGGTNSRGIFVNRYANNVSVLNNNVHDIRTGIIVDGRNVNAIVTGNIVDNTKSGISVQYTDGSNLTLTGNREGAVGNEWGINVLLNGVLQADGVTILPSTSNVGGVFVGVLGTANLAEQARILAMSTANNGMSAQNIAYSAANRTRAYVAVGGGTNTQGSRLSALDSIQAGVNAVVTGGTVYVGDGSFTGNVSIAKAGVSLLSTNGRDATTIQGAVGGGVNGAVQVSAANVTIGGTGHGFTIIGYDGATAGVEAAGVYVLGASGLTIADNRITANGEYGLLTTGAVNNLTVTGNIFDGKTFVGANPAGDGFSQQFTLANVPRQLVTINPGGSGVTFTNNQIVGTSGGINAAGREQGNTLVTIDSNNATITGNTFAGTTSATAYGLRARGTNATITGNIFDNAHMGGGTSPLFVNKTVFGTGPDDFAGMVAANSFTGGGAWAESSATSSHSVSMNIGLAVGEAAAGTTVHVFDGTYTLGSQLVINKALTLIGQSQAGVVIDGRTVNVGGNGLGTISVIADNVTLGNFTLLGSQLSGGNYGIKVQPNPAGHVNTAGGDSQRLNNFAISDVTVRGSLKAELDLNGVVNATIANFTADGQGTEGAGVQITDSSNVTLTGVHTLGNNWGGVALYQSNKASGYNAQTTDININAAQNNFEEVNGLFAQLESTTKTFGTLNLTGFNFAVRNTGSRPDGYQFTWFQTDTNHAKALVLALGATATSSIEGWDVNAGTNQFSVFDGMTINAALRDARAGATVSVAPGNYLEGVTGVNEYGGAGAQTFGLYVAKDDITIRGVDASGNAITDADDVVAFITARYQAGFGAQHFISGSGVTIEGLGFLPAAAGDNKTVEVIGDAFTLRNSVIDNRGNPTAGALYIDDFNDPAHARVETFTITGNKFYGGTDGGGIVTIASGAGASGATSGRIFSDNYLWADVAGTRGFQIKGLMPNTPWQPAMAGAVTVTGNFFDVDIPVRVVGVINGTIDWTGLLQNNSYLRGGVLAFVGNTDVARGTVIDGDLDIRITSSIADQLVVAQNGDTVRLLDGTYVLGSQLAITKSITLVGQSQANTIIDGSTVNDGGGLGTIGVYADDTTLSNFTLLGSTLSGGNYGIKVQPNPLGYAPSQRINNITISDVTVKGSRRGELDINGAVGVTVTNFTADGQGTDGAGVQITDSANVTLTGVHTLGNNWGGVALYQTNRGGGYDGQTTNINIDAGQNDFDEANGLFAQLESTTQGFGTLNLTGYGYAVRNFASRADGNQFTYFRTDLADATAWATTLGTGSSSIEGYTGTGFSNQFTVLDGFTIAAAMRDVRSGGTVNVGAGTFNEAVAITKSLTLDGAGIDATSITGGIAITSGFTGLMLRGFTVSGSANGTSVIGNSGTLTDLTMDHVRIDGLGVANRHGFIGGQIGGDIAITNSEFRNIRGWAAFDTRSGASGNDGAQIASAVFSNNLIDNTIGHINFRQQIGAATLPNVTFSGNTVTNVGDATNSFGAIFKAFNANTVDFTGNDVSDVGTSGFNPAGEAAYGAVLMVRGATTLNVTGNSFTDNNQVFAVEPGRGLPTVTNFSNNVFTNNKYSIYLPTSLAGAGTINFGAGNNFVAGANTAQHIVWRSATGLDLTNVLFDGSLASSLGIDARFAIEDLITDGIDRSGAGLARIAAGQIYVTTASGTDSLLRAAALAQAGDTINLSAGDHATTSTLYLDTDGVTLLGQGQGATSILAGGNASYGVRVHGDDVTLGGFTLTGFPAGSAAIYGIKVESGGDLNARNDGFTIHDVTVSGSHKTGLDLNAVTNALVDGVTVTGTTAGNGIAITDSAGVTVRNSHTSGNAWGGLALYQSNNIGGGGSNQQLTGVTVEASNVFAEANGVYLQDTSALLNPGALTVLGYDFVVRDGGEYSFFQKDLASASSWALGLANPSAMSVEGWNGSAGTNAFTVSNGLTIGAAARDVRADGTINVLAGTYGSGTVIATDGVSLLGAAGAKIDASHDGDNGITINADRVSVSGFEIFGPANQSYVTYSWPTITRGIVLHAGADNATISGNNIHDVRNGILVDGPNPGGMIVNNAIDNTKSAISVQYSDGSELTIAGNHAGTFGNEWGIIVNLQGGGALGAATPILEQQRLLALRDANNGFEVYNQAYTAANRTAAYVATTGVAGAQGSQRTLTNLQGGFDAVVEGGTVHIAGGTYSEDAVLNGLRVLDMGAPITVNSLTFGAGAAGTNIGTSITATGALSFADGLVLTGDTALTGDTISLGAITSSFGLTLTGTNGVSIGLADLASLTATGSSITTGGAFTSGSQHYDGATSLNGTYSAGGTFTVTGLASLAGDTNVSTSGGAIAFANLTGTHSLTADADTGSVTLGTANGLASLSAFGATITSAGASTSGAQSYNGATTLNGTYSTNGAGFGVDGAATLGSDTNIATAGGDIVFGSTVGGAHALGADAGTGTINFNGAVAGLTGLAAIGGDITTLGVATDGNQSYTGATLSLAGSYTSNGGSFTVNAASTLDANVSIATDGGAATLGTVDGSGNSLTVDAGAGAAVLGAATDLGTLDITGGTIVTAGAASSGAQSYTGATSLAGLYSTDGAAFTVNGAATLAGLTTVETSDGNIGLGGGVSGAHALAADAGAGSIMLGASNLGSLDLSGGTIATSGVTSTGSQGYTGATTLAGTYASGGDFTVNGATTVAAATGLTAGGDASFGTIGGTGALSIDAGANGVTLGAVSGLASLSVTSSTIATAGAATSGAQNFTGATSLDGAYSTNGGTFAVTGAATLAGATSVATSGGNATLGAVSATGTGNGLSVDAGTGSVTLGAATGLGSLSATGATIATSGAATSGAQSYIGATSLNGSYTAGGDFTVNGATTLGSSASVTSGGSAGFGTIGGTGSLDISATNVTLGAVTGLASLSATGSTIATAGASTTGTQSYTGATTLNGSYASNGGAFTVNGVTTLGGDTSVTTSGGNAGFGNVGGTGSLGINAGTGNVTLGAVTGLSGLTATGAAISTSGAVTTGAQSYTGATLLRGTFTTGGGAFTVNGAVTLGSAAGVVTGGGTATLGTIAGGGNALAVNAGTGNVTIGAASGLASLSATGASIATSGVTTTGNQSYAGATSLDGTYGAGGDFTVTGATTLGGDSLITTAGNAALGTVGGTGSLNVNGANVTLGAVTGLSSLTASGATVATAGASTAGAQTYNGATTLSGAYDAGGNFTVNGAATIGGNSSVTSGGDASFGTIGGTGSLGVSATNVTLGAVSGLASLSATGTTITTSGAATSGAQSYTGATSLDGAYTAGGDFTVTGAATLNGDTNVTASNASFGTVTGTNALAVDATGNVTLGAVSGLASLSVTGSTIATAGAATSGAQSFTGATSLDGAYSTNGGTFAVTGAATLGGATSVATSGGNATLGTVSATGTGNGLSVDAGTGSVTLGAATGLGSLSATGATIATSGAATSGAQSYTGATSLNGSYAAGGDFTVNGATTIDVSTSVTSGGNAGFGAVGGTGSLDVSATNVTLGAVTGLASLSATGTTIATASATTTGAQSYTGATSLNGAYDAGGDFTVTGATTVAGGTNVSTDGNAGFAAIGGTGSLRITATGGVTLGAVNGLASLSVSSATIATSGASTSGVQYYGGATTLNGTYTAGGNFSVEGRATVAGSTSISSGGSTGLALTRGSGSLTITATGDVTLGSVNGLASLSVTGTVISTYSVITTGAQSYTGMTRLNGAYTTGGSNLTVNGPAYFGNDARITTGGGNFTVNGPSQIGLTTMVFTDGGDAKFGTVAGNPVYSMPGTPGIGGLIVGAGTGNVTLGGVSGIAWLTASGATITTSGVSTADTQHYTGATTLAGAYDAGGNFTVTGATTLGGDSTITSGGNASLGTIGGTGSLDVGATDVSLGTVTGLTSLSVTGTTIATAGASTAGAQNYTGATTLNGAYTAGTDFIVNGATTLGGNSSVTSGSDASFGTVGGTGSLDVSATNVTLGAVTGLASLSATGPTIATAGATTSGAQSYTGATTLSGAYTAGGDFTVDGAATLGGDTGVAADNAGFGTVTGAHALAVDATGNVTLGTVSGLTALSASGATIATNGASTSGAQSYTGATSLTGAYDAGGDFTVSGAATVSGSTGVATGGDASFGTVGGAGSLAVDAGAGNVTLGTVSGLAGLSATGGTIATNGAATNGLQSYNGATSLNGVYSTNGGAFAVNGAATTVNAVDVATAGGDASFGTVGGAGGLSVDAGTGNVSLGAVSGIASLSATGATVATAGAATAGAQSYTGATSLNGTYATNGGAFTVNGAGTLGGNTDVATGGGNAALGTVGGTGSLSVNAGTGSVSLGAVSGLTGLSATGSTIATNGAATSGVQSYAGATSLNGAYTTGGGAFTVSGATSLAGTTSVTSGNGAITLGAVDAAVAGDQGLALDAGTGSAALGNLGAIRRLGATSVNAGTTVLNGATYAANSLGFTGDAGASVRLTQGTTTFNTSLPGGAGGAITIQPDLVGTANAQQNVAFTAGNGLTVNSGDVAIGNAGSDAIRLGTMTVLAHNFSAATVKLASTFTSVLSGSQVFSANTLDTLGNVNAFVAGNESGPIRAGGSVTIDAGGSGSGSIIAGGAVSMQYDSSVNRAVTSQSNVTIQSLGTIGGSVNAGGAVNLQTTTGAITGTVTATGPVNASSTSGSITAAITSNGAVTLGSTSGTIGGTVTAGGPVAIGTTSGGVTSTVTTPGTASITSQSGPVAATVTGNGGVSVTTNGPISGDYSSTTTIALTSTRPVDVQVNGSVVTVTAPGGTVGGVFSEIHTNDQGTFVVNDQPVVGSGTTDARQIIIDTFILPARGTLSANGEIQLPAGLALGLIAPAGNGQGGQRPAVVVNSVQRLGELLREGYTAIIIQLDETNLDLEEEVAGQ